MKRLVLATLLLIGPEASLADDPFAAPPPMIVDISNIDCAPIQTDASISAGVHFSNNEVYTMKKYITDKLADGKVSDAIAAKIKATENNTIEQVWTDAVVACTLNHGAENGLAFNAQEDLRSSLDNEYKQLIGK